MSSNQPYQLDTTVLIDASRGREPATSWLDEAVVGPGEVGISTVTVAEFLAGVQPQQRGDVLIFIKQLAHWDVTTEIAIRAGALRYDLARRGRILLIPDALIAATALAYGAVLVTSNIRDFTETGITGVSLAPRA